MDKLLPTLEQICYEVLAEYAGYIDDVSVLRDDSIIAICQKSDVFGLANLDNITQDMDLDLSDSWEFLYRRIVKENPDYLAKEVGIIVGDNFYKQALWTSIMKHELEARDLDDEDMEQLVGSLSNSLKLLVFHKTPSISPNQLFPQFEMLLHLDISNSKLGPDSGSLIADLIRRNRFLHNVNIRNVILGDAATCVVAEALEVSQSVNNVDLAFNDIGIDGVSRICTCILNNHNLVIVNLSRNLGPRTIKQGYRVAETVKKARPTVQLALV